MPGLRPTPDRIRETLFNWLAPMLAGARCLDLYAGTGALGFEALSRGAASADFVERSAAAAAGLRESARLLAANGAVVHERDAFEFLARHGAAGPFDVVFLDPPFSEARYAELCTLLDVGGWLAPGAVVYIEQEREAPPPELPAGWQAEKEKTAGNVRFMLVRTATEGNRT